MTDFTYSRGDRIAWVEKRIIGAKRVTDGFSLLHRTLENGLTFCQLTVPDPVFHMTPFESFGVCPRCEGLYEEGATNEDCRARLMDETRSMRGAA